MRQQKSCKYALHNKVLYSKLEQVNTCFARPGVSMNQLSASSFAVQIRNRSRSMGLKLMLVSGLALLMLIPSLFVNSIVEERTNRAKSVVQEIGGRAGGQQTFLGPTLSIPYNIPSLYKGASPTPGTYVVFP